MIPSSLLALAATISSASAVIYQGFNYGATQSDGSVKDETAFQDEFTTAANLAGTAGAFTSARLFTMIQGDTTDTPTSAIPAAIATKTSLLLGLWASAGQATITSEIAALNAAITQYGSSFTSLIAGVSVGSEDLYRISPTGIANDAGVGAEPADIVNYISQVRSALSAASLSLPVGHVDTWTAWVNASNDAVITACDFLGMDAYPYFQPQDDNSIANGNATFWSAYDATVAAATGKPVWITETGWPVSGSTDGEAVPSTANAQTYWDAVGCSAAFGTISTWWFTLQDAYPVTPNPSFGIVGSVLSDTPLYDLAC